MSNEDIKAQLEAAKNEAAELRRQNAEAAAELSQLKAKVYAGDTALPIQGKYKQHQFADGHRRVRNKSGELCDTEKLLAAAADKESPDQAQAVETLDWLIEIGYEYFKKK